MVFITTGSQKFQFDRLLKKVDSLIEEGVITEEVFAQIGSSEYVPKHYEYVDFLDKETFAAKMQACDVIIAHGGAGIIITGVKLGKKVIAVPRRAQFNEHVDDHQVELIEAFGSKNIICACMDMDDLGKEFAGIRDREFDTYVSNTKNIIDDIEGFLNGEIC